MIDLISALTSAIDELTRPVDAIKHQAKTVTVGISRSDETLLQVPLVHAVLSAGAPRDGLSYRALRTLVDLDPAVVEVTGYTRYRVEGDLEADARDLARHRQGRDRERARVARRVRSRAAWHEAPRRHATRGHRRTRRRDGRTLVIVPEVKHNQTVGLTLLHVRFADHLPPDVMRGVLQGYQGRYGALKDAVTETEPTFDESRPRHCPGRRPAD